MKIVLSFLVFTSLSNAITPIAQPKCSKSYRTLALNLRKLNRSLVVNTFSEFDGILPYISSVFREPIIVVSVDDDFNLPDALRQILNRLRPRDASVADVNQNSIESFQLAVERRPFTLAVIVDPNSKALVSQDALAFQRLINNLMQRSHHPIHALLFHSPNPKQSQSELWFEKIRGFSRP